MAPMGGGGSVSNGPDGWGVAWPSLGTAPLEEAPFERNVCASRIRLQSRFAASHRATLPGISHAVGSEGRAAHPLHDSFHPGLAPQRSEEHTSELQSLMRTSYAVFCWKKQHTYPTTTKQTIHAHNHNSSYLGTN